VQCIKIVVGSPRPVHALTDPTHMPFSLKASHHSFPSGHTTEIVNASATLALWFRNSLFSFGMGLLIALVGYSRIHLSQHRLSDVIAGMMLGTLASLLIHFLSSREYRYEYSFRQVSR
jgi:Membrane-associated phospholipid phosphatase